MLGTDRLPKRKYKNNNIYKKEYVPAPVTSATLPSSLAELRPRGPGIWSYLLEPEGAVTPGIFAAGVALIVAGVVVELELLDETDTVWCFFSVVLALLDEKWDRRQARKAGRAIEEQASASSKLGGTGCLLTVVG